MQRWYAKNIEILASKKKRILRFTHQNPKSKQGKNQSTDSSCGYLGKQNNLKIQATKSWFKAKETQKSDEFVRQ